MAELILPNPDLQHNPSTVAERIFQKCAEMTPEPVPGGYAVSFDNVGESLTAVINCPLCRNTWEVEFPTIEMVTHYAMHYGHIIALSDDGELLWLLTCPRCVINANDPRARYQDYLRSPHWQVTKAAALERASHRCQLCNSPDRLQVHHRSYRNRGHEQPGDLTVLCADCHKLFHEYRELTR